MDLPTYERQLVIECYLEVGKPFYTVITESVDFYAPTELPLVSGATVTITHRGEIYTLDEGIFVDTSTTDRFFNYGNPTLCPSHYNEDFTIEVIDNLGRKATATTQILKPVLIDTLETVWRTIDGDSSALVFTRFYDPPEEDNFYRRIFQSGGVLGEGRDEQDFTTTDNFAGDDNQIVYGTGYDFEKGDTIISAIYNIDEAFYDFRESVENAVASNGNPFGQPGVIKYNIEGGIGIFTGLSFDRDTIIIE